MEGGGGAARVDGDGGVSAVDRLDEMVDDVGSGAVRPREVTPSRGRSEAATEDGRSSAATAEREGDGASAFPWGGEGG